MSETDLSDILSEELEEKVKEAAEISMGKNFDWKDFAKNRSSIPLFTTIK